MKTVNMISHIMWHFIGVEMSVLGQCVFHIACLDRNYEAVEWWEKGEKLMTTFS